MVDASRPGNVDLPLNAAQREAVVTTEGPVLVLAGAGTGKTRVITYRIAHLLRRGVPAEHILAVTFTNKAAREMRDRVAEILGKPPKGLTVSTFHSLGARILRTEAAALGYRRDFSIHDEGDQLSVVRTVLRETAGAEAGKGARGVLAEISRAKNRFASPRDLEESASTEWDRLVAHCYGRYGEELRAMSCVDFDDLIFLPVRLFQENDEVRRRYRARFRYLLVDEYQDTNGSQYSFLQLIVNPGRNICVVGDDDQSIYGFRGAEVDKILGFERDFPGARVIKLEENYRSTGAILSLANVVIAASPARHEKALRSTLGQGSPVRWVATPDDAREVDYVLHEIQVLTRRQGVPAGSIAILIRAIVQARPFEEKLRLRRIPYVLVGGQSYFDRKEVRDVLAYWMAAANPRDDISLLRILNVPRRGLGPGAVGKLDELARSRKASILDALDLAAGGEGDFPDAVRRAAAEVTRVFRNARERIRERRFGAMARGIVEDADYRRAVADLYPDPTARQARWTAVEELLAWVESWERESPGRDFTEFLEAVSLDRDAREESRESPRAVTIMTLHGAKGLEFPHVFLVGVEEDILPHRKSIEEGDRGVEEERRLFYVGITRARKSLTITHAAARILRGGVRERIPSRFLLEVADRGLLETETYDPHTPATEDDLEEILESYRRARTGPGSLAGPS